MEKDLIKLNVRKIESAIQNIVGPAKQILPGIVSRNKKKVKDDLAKSKLEIVENYYKDILRFEKVLKKFQSDLNKMEKDGK